MEEDIELTELKGIQVNASDEARQMPDPYWATIKVSGQFVVSNFSACSCGFRQEKVRYGERGGDRDVQKARALVIEKVYL